MHPRRFSWLLPIVLAVLCGSACQQPVDSTTVGVQPIALEQDPASAPIVYTEPRTASKRIAITLDDAPLMRFHSHPSDWHRTLVIDSLHQALARHRAPATAFVIGSLVEEEAGAALMRYWMEKGIQIGNHSMTHRDFGTLSVEEGREEISEAQNVLAPLAAEFQTPLRYFRFPRLSEGATAEAKEAWLTHLNEVGLTNARVTISHDDWSFDERYMAAELAEDWALRYEIGQEYMAHVQEAIAYWEAEAERMFERPVNHVILFHANRINRDYLGQILTLLMDEGYSFITLDEAYQDPLYQARDQWVSTEGTSFLENIKQTRMQQAEASVVDSSRVDGS